MYVYTYCSSMYLPYEVAKCIAIKLKIAVKLL